MYRVLHALEHSLPILTGYTIRSKYIVDHQLKSGIEPIVITSPLQGKTDRPLQQYEEFNSIRYYRTGRFNKLNMSEPLPLRIVRRYAYSRDYLRAIKDVGQKEKIHLIHSHSSYLNGVRGNDAAQVLGIPSVYEVRGLWEDSATIIQNISPRHWKYRFITHMNRKALLGADMVVTLSKQLADELINQGVQEDRLCVVPNGVDSTIFAPRDKNVDILERHALKNKIVFGFIGSIRKIEGLSLFLEYLPNMIDKIKDIHVLLIGEGDEVPRLKEIVYQNSLNDYVTFTGKVPHHHIFDYYSVVDIFLYPRINARVNHKVTPLKPLEAMSMKKVVIASDVGGFRELIEDGENGLLFRVDDGEHLIHRCLELIENPNLRMRIGKKARDWIIQEREWAKIIKLYQNVYSQAINS